MGLKQAELAKRAQVSPSYLNLIEHNRRRIGGKLLLDIADILEVEPSVLTSGAEAGVLSALRQAAAQHSSLQPETDRAEEFAGRFPGWARIIHAALERQASLEQTVASLSDRMTHDPQLAEALHDMVGAITGIRSTASILASGDDLEPEWRNRFSRNINEDAERLAESSQSLVTFLGSSSAQSDLPTTTPQDELQTWLEAAGHRFDALEAAQGASEQVIPSILEAAAEVLSSASARSQARGVLERYAADAQALPYGALISALGVHGLDPGALADALDQPVARVMRRLASLPGTDVDPYLTMPAPGGLGLAICDASGTLTYRKPIAGFSLPRFGAACPLWPLYQALTRVGAALHAQVEVEARDTALFDCFAIAAPQGPVRFDAPSRVEALMLLVPTTARANQVTPVGSGCRLCAQSACAARREPSVLASSLSSGLSGGLSGGLTGGLAGGQAGEP